MSDADRWTATRSASGNIEHLRLFEDGRQLTFERYLALLREERAFSRWYTQQLTNSPFAAFFWEHPPLLLRSHVEKLVEFVLVDAPMLSGLTQDDTPFRAYFDDDPFVQFPSLGGDALLLAPSPIDATTEYAHLAAFLRSAKHDQVQALWRMVGMQAAATLSNRPLWLSTSGLGVSWLHVRLDTTPKYYQYQPYKRPPAANGRPGR